MRVLVIGGSGQVGRALAEILGDCCATPSRSGADLRDPASLRRWVHGETWDAVVNAAAYTDVDGAETNRETAFAVNAAGAGTLAALTEAARIPVIHLSTDYVFDGEKATPYVENDPVAPLSVYGRSKEAGERAIREATARHFIIRTSWVFSPFGRNFVKTMLRLATESDTVRVVDDQWGNPTAAHEIANAVAAVCHALNSETGVPPYGTYHFAGAGSTSWAGFAEAVFSLSAARGGPVARVEPIPSAAYPTAARRPANSRLDTGLFQKTFGVAPSVWENTLGRTLDRLIGAADGTNRKSERQTP